MYREYWLFVVNCVNEVSDILLQPCVPIVFHRRSPESLEKLGTNLLVEWKPDSSMIVIAVISSILQYLLHLFKCTLSLIFRQTSEGHLLFYDLGVIAEQKGLYIQTDSPHANLRRDSAELFIKEIIPPLHLSMVGFIFRIQSNRY